MEKRRNLEQFLPFSTIVCNLTPVVGNILKILWKRGEIAPLQQFLLFSTIFCYLLLDFHVKTGTRFSLRHKRLFEISEQITRVDCFCNCSCVVLKDEVSSESKYFNPLSKLFITKTRLFKYIENFTSKKTWKISDKKLWYFSCFCSKHRLWVLVRTASSRWF